MPFSHRLKAFCSRPSKVAQMVDCSGMVIGRPAVKFRIAGLVGVQPPIGAK